MMHDEFVGAFAEVESFGFSMSGGQLLVNG
jgi:hypothetical protein